MFGISEVFSGGKWAKGFVSGWALPKPKKPELVSVDPAAEQAAAENKAAAAANAKAANRKRASRNSSLLATGGAGVSSPAQTQSLLAYGKQKLGD
jgi:hypothetical protein